jgi:hypothetical protein
VAELDLFGEVPAGTPQGHGLGPKGGKHYVKPWGYYMPPGTGPAGETCRTCKYIGAKGNVAGRYLKCGRMFAKWTGGRKTDILAGSPACSGWEPQPDNSSGQP